VADAARRPLLHDGRWLFIPVMSETDAADVEQLLLVKRRPVKKSLICQVFSFTAQPVPADAGSWLHARISARESEARGGRPPA